MKRKEAKERKEAKKQEKLIRKPLQKSIDKSLEKRPRSALNIDSFLLKIDETSNCNSQGSFEQDRDCDKVSPGPFCFIKQIN